MTMMSIRTVKRIIRRNMNLSVPFYIMAAYAYHVEDDPIMDDEAFDYLARFLQRQWWQLRHAHKWLIDRHNTKSSHDIDWPSIIPYALKDFRS